MRKMFRKGGAITCLAVALFAMLSGCKDECSVGKSECKKGNVLRTCVKTDDGNQWVYNQCGSNEECKNADELDGGSGPVTAADSGAALTLSALTSGDSSGVTAACIGACAAGEHECLGATTSRLCAGDGVWQIIPCTFGQECLDGVCKASTGPNVATLCKANTRACASDKVAKVCNPDGTAWTEVPCQMNETCVKSECVPDLKSSCDDMNMCIDSTTAARCQAGGQGFTLVECPKGTWCEGGNCQGEACVLGKTCNGPNQIRDCKDGAEFVDTQCGADEVCQQLKDDAKCVKQACTVGTTQCGDPRDTKVDTTTQFTTCVADPAGSALNRWVVGTCEGTTTCSNDPDNNPATPTPAAPCTQDCTPGAIQCAPFTATGVSAGTQECDKNGKWGPVKNCNKTVDTQRVCVGTVTKPGELPNAVCAEPVCAQVIAHPESAQGFCENGKLRKCLEDGTLEDKATDCAPGRCVDGDQISPDPNFLFTPSIGTDGRMPGLCDTGTVCKDGETTCVGGSIFQTCVNGFWSATLSSCAKDAVCRNTTDADGLLGHFCGGECAPGAKTCDFSTAASTKKIFTCGKDGKLDDGVKCPLGYCATTGTDAVCVIDCVPGSSTCTGAPVVAPDGYHSGTDMEMKCGSDGTFATATACAAGTACRTSGIGVDIGCVECVGPAVAGGNDEGRADTTCDPAAPADSLLSCKADNTWDAAHTCSGTTTCAGPSGPTCGMCFTAAFNYVQCTNTNVNDNETCGACDADGAGPNGFTSGACTAANINAVNGGSGGCADAGLGAASPFGGVQCCSGGSHRTGTASCDSLGRGSPVAAGSIPDCCGDYVTTSSGVSFAACYEP